MPQRALSSGLSTSMIETAELEPRASSTSNSLPYVFPPSQEWLGNDGSWSTFILRVGTPPEAYQILPATNIQETWVPLSQACASSDYNRCTHLRGIEPDQPAAQRGFQLNQSSTWVKEGIYNLLSEGNLGYTGNGEYGFDTVRLGPPALDGPSLNHQVVAGIVTTDFYLGLFGLGPKPANFSDFNDPIPSYMKTMVDKKMIPSMSYGYTAGAKYRLGGVHGSLTLGGYDQSRFIPNNVSFDFDSDDSRSLTLAVQSITANNTLQGDVTPLALSILSLIDSTVPHIWLPKSACLAFEQAFGLIYDNMTDLYVINDTIHKRLQKINPTVKFTLGNAVSGGDTVDINLSYGAFDLQASSPTYVNTTRYFPLRRAKNESQYTLGRTFLQEAYVIADYERMNFTVSQAVLRSDNNSQIVAITSDTGIPHTEAASSNTSTSKLQTGQISGIILGALAIVALVAVLGLLCFHRKRKRPLSESHAKPMFELPERKSLHPAPSSPPAGHPYKRNWSSAGKAVEELPAHSRNEKSSAESKQSKPQELLGSPTAAELESRWPYAHNPRLKHCGQLNRANRDRFIG